MSRWGVQWKEQKGIRDNQLSLNTALKSYKFTNNYCGQANLTDEKRNKESLNLPWFDIFTAYTHNLHHHDIFTAGSEITTKKMYS